MALQYRSQLSNECLVFRALKTNASRVRAFRGAAPTLTSLKLTERHGRLVPAIHVVGVVKRRLDVDARDIGERSDAVLRTATRGHDE